MNADVIICGSGPSGICAALSAARKKLKVLLIEKNGYVGGNNTAGLVGPFMTFHSGNTQVIKGIAQEIVDELIKKQASIGHVKDIIGQCATVTPFDSNILRLVYFEMLKKEKNITLLLNTYLSDVKVRNNKIVSIEVVNKDGKSEISAPYFIDATGDGDLAWNAKVDYDLGRKIDGLSQPMSIMFKVGGVNLKETRAYIKKHPESIVWEDGVSINEYLGVSGFCKEINKAKKTGEFTIPRDRVLFFESTNPNEIIMNTTRIIEKSGVNAKDLTDATMEGYRQIDELMTFMKNHIPGFKDAYIVQIADQIGVRESRRFKCIETLTIKHVMEKGTTKNSIAVCAYPMDIHDPKGAKINSINASYDFAYEIPYGVMVPHKITNLLITGRCISAEHEALASVRTSPTMMALGQAAGTAARQCVRENKSFKDVDIRKLQKELIKDGAIVFK